jgi:flagellar biosynthetic protein FliR
VANSLPLQIDALLPAFFRLLPLLVLFPVPGLDRLPASVRIFFCLAMTVCLAGAIAPASGNAVVMEFVAQFLLGTALALGVHAAVAGIHTGGALIDTQAGTNAAVIFNPAQSSGGVFAEFLILASAITILLSDAVLLLLGKTLALAPGVLLDGSGEQLLHLLSAFGEQMAAGFLLTLPIVAGLWLMDVLAAFSSRLLPQAHVYFLFLPVKTLFATLLLIAWITLFVTLANALVLRMPGM